jgi:CrcB protein
VTGVLVVLAAGIGAMARYLVDSVVQRRLHTIFPYGTWVVNLTGSLLLGALVGASVARGWDRTAVDIVGAGLLGGYTTLSTWAWESVALAGEGDWWAATANSLGSWGAALLAAAAGLALGSVF